MSTTKQTNMGIETIENLIHWEIRDFVEYGFKLERRALVEYLPKIGKIQVYNDHNPPHFHIENAQYNLVVSINDCEIIKGDLSSKQRKNLEKWFFKNAGKEKLISFWNKFNEENLIKT